MTGPALVEAMAHARLTCADLARLLGVSRETVVSWRISRRAPCCAHMKAALERALARVEVEE